MADASVDAGQLPNVVDILFPTFFLATIGWTIGALLVGGMLPPAFLGAIGGVIGAWIGSTHPAPVPS